MKSLTLTAVLALIVLALPVTALAQAPPGDLAVTVDLTAPETTPEIGAGDAGDLGELPAMATASGAPVGLTATRYPGPVGDPGLVIAPALGPDAVTAYTWRPPD